MLIWWILAAAVVGALAFVFWKRQRKPPSNPDFEAFMVNAANEAVAIAREDYGVVLDYTPESIERLERLLGGLYEEHQRDPFPEKLIGFRSLVFGAYIGETLRRVRPGRWLRDSELGGTDTMPVVFNETNEGHPCEAFPCAWVHKRLTQGEWDNVWSKFRFAAGAESYWKGAQPAGQEE